MAAMSKPRNQALAVRLRLAGNRPLKKAPVRPSTKGVEGEYLRTLLLYVTALRRATREVILPALPGLLRQAARERQDSYLDDLQSLIERAMREVSREFPDDRLAAFAREAAQRTDRFSGSALAEQIKAIAEIDLHTSTPGLPARIATFTRDNVELIKSIGTTYHRRIEQIVTENVRIGARASSPDRPARGIDEDFTELGEVTERRAALIARDQVLKFSGEVTRSRQSDLGISEYIWHNSDDERVRGNPGGLYPKARHSHWDREGKVFSWADPPPDGHPGYAIQCRCWAEPVLDGLLP